MKFFETFLSGAYVVETEPFTDHRGLFARTYCKEEFSTIGHSAEFVQFNHSRTISRGAIRGLHYQVPPASEIKLIRCIRGSVFDVIVDIRSDSSTFLQYESVELSASNMKMIYVPEGFAHGFQTLEADTELIYHHTSFYNRDLEGALRYNDPSLGIKWPLEPTDLSEKDKSHPLINQQFKGIAL